MRIRAGLRKSVPLRPPGLRGYELRLREVAHGRVFGALGLKDEA